MKRQNAVEIELLPKIDKTTKIMMLGSCFTTEIGSRLKKDGFNISINPFGILFNPASIASSIRRMISGVQFVQDDVISSDGKFTSFFHHSTFSKETPEEFLTNANESLDHSITQFKEAELMIVTFGTAWVFRHIGKNLIVSNCHKIVAKEFIRERLSVEKIVAEYSTIISELPHKKWIFTVSPIRHLADGSHGNQISKSTLLIAIEQLQERFDNVYYFPSYEIMMDELRDFSCYAEDTVHPSISSVDYIYETFKKSTEL